MSTQVSEDDERTNNFALISNLSTQTDEYNDKDEDLLDLPLIRDWTKLIEETLEVRLQRYIDYFTIPVSKLQTMADTFRSEIQTGLRLFAEKPYVWQPDKCCFKMLDSCISTLPSGNESGVYYALDFGGTNFRAVRGTLHGKGKISICQHNVSLSQATVSPNLKNGLLDSQATATELFDFFAMACKELMIAQKDLVPDSEAPNMDKESLVKQACFTFSFPCNQRQVDSAVLMEWTKGFETGRNTLDPVEGNDVVQLTQLGFYRSNIPLHINSTINDTVGTLLSCCYEIDLRKHPPCKIGLIIGTGFNACYYEPEALQYGYKGRIINLECGNYCRDLPFTNVDNELDFAEDSNRGRQRLEKMIGGAYLGELARRAIVRVLRHQAPSRAWIPYSLRSKDVSLIVGDNSPSLKVTAAIIDNAWGESFENRFLIVVHELCSRIMLRSAALTAMMIVGTAKQTKYLQPSMGGLSVGIDGALYKNLPIFRENVKHFLKEILGEKTNQLLHLLTANDGSGKGAVVLAAVLKNKKDKDI